MSTPRRVGRKLLIASIGVATVSYVACDPNPPPIDANDAAVTLAPSDGAASLVVVDASSVVDAGAPEPNDAATPDASARDAGVRDAGTKKAAVKKRTPEWGQLSGNLMAP